VAAPLDDHVGRAIFYVGELDKKVTWVCSRLVRQGDSVLDIGANLGLVTFILSRLVGATGRVYAFEPSPKMQQYIEAGIERNRADNISLYRIALGREHDQLRLRIPRGNAGSASLIPERLQGAPEEVVVPVERLSDIFSVESPPKRVRLIKIDVEGFEPHVIAGASEFIDRVKPDAILFELNDIGIPASHHPTVELLAELGYGFISLPRNFLRMRPRKFPPSDPGIVPTGNDFVAAPLGDKYEEVARRLHAR